MDTDTMIIAIQVCAVVADISTTKIIIYEFYFICDSHITR